MKMAYIASIRSRAPLWALAFAVVAAAIGGTLAAAFPAQSLPDNILIPNYSPGTMPFHPGEELVYQASWIGIPAAGGRVVLRPNPRDPGLLHAEIEVSTNRLIDRFYKMRDYLDEDFTAGSLMPATMQIRQNEGRRHDTFNVTFDHREHLVTLVKHGPRGVQVHKFTSYHPSGPVSGAIMALSQPLVPGETLSFDAFSGTTRYVLELKVIKRERIGTPLGEFDCFRIVPSITYLSQGKVNDKVHDTTLWVSADARRLPLRIESAVFIGSVRIDLVNVVNADPRDSAGEQAHR